MNNFRANNKIKGAGTALVTPFNKDFSIDIPALRDLVESNIAGGMDFLCVLGTTAETPTLTESEKMTVRNTVLEVNHGSVPLLLGYGGNNTMALTEALKNDDLTGFDAILSVSPYYNKPNQEGLYRHFKAVADASPLPVVLYNIPGRTGVNIEVPTLFRLIEDCPKIVGVKEASGKIDQIFEILKKKPSDFVLLSGDDGLTLKIMQQGGNGAISVVSNARPAEVCAVVRGDMDVDAKLSPLYKLLFAEGNPTGIKALMSLENKMENVLRMPLVEASKELMTILAKFANTK